MITRDNTCLNSGCKMPRGLPMVGALVRDDAKKIQIVVEYKADSEGEFIRFSPKVRRKS